MSAKKAGIGLLTDSVPEKDPMGGIRSNASVRLGAAQRLILLAAGFVFLLASPGRTAEAQPRPSPDRAAASAGTAAPSEAALDQGNGPAALDRFLHLPLPRQEAILNSLPPGRRVRLLQQLDRYLRMSAEERQRLRKQMREFRAQPHERQQQMRHMFRRLNQLPPARREIVRREVLRLRRLPPPLRRQRLRSEWVERRFTPWEREILAVLGGVTSPGG